MVPLNAPLPWRVSSTRHGARVYSDKGCGPDKGCAKYPSTSITRSVALLGYTLMAPCVPEGTRAALAVIVPVSAFKVETSGFGCPVGHTVMSPSGPGGVAANFREEAIR